MPNDGDRGELYAELERACDELDKTLEMLKKAGYTLREFSKVLEADPTGILVTHYPTGYMIYPDEIKELFMAPPDVLHPGEGARVLEPVVGANSVILLDEAAHMEQRKLMLPSFHGRER